MAPRPSSGKRPERTSGFAACATKGTAARGIPSATGVSHSHGDVVGFIDADNKTEIGALDQVLEELENPVSTGFWGTVPCPAPTSRMLGGRTASGARNCFGTCSEPAWGFPDFPTHSAVSSFSDGWLPRGSVPAAIGGRLHVRRRDPAAGGPVRVQPRADSDNLA